MGEMNVDASAASLLLTSSFHCTTTAAVALRNMVCAAGCPLVYVSELDVATMPPSPPSWEKVSVTLLTGCLSSLGVGIASGSDKYQLDRIRRFVRTEAVRRRAGRPVEDEHARLDVEDEGRKQ
jgi:hypothetical protein